MAVPKFAWGIDIGNRALKAVKLVATAEGLVIDDFDVIEHENVLSAAGDNRESMIQSALANFVQRHPGIDKGQVAVGVTGQQSFARFIKLPPVEPKKIPEIVRFEAIQQIPFPLDEVEWSYQLFQDPESPDVEVGIFAMRKDLVNQHIRFFTDAKLNVQAVQMNPLAVYNAMYYDSRIKGTTMIIDVGAENTDLIIAEGETIWLRSISIGGNNFTESLTKAFKVNFAKAEDLKRNASTSKYGRQIMQAMRPIFSDLVSEIQRSIGFYSSVHKESRINKVIAIGSTFRLPGLQKYLSQNLTLDVEKLDRLGSGALEDPKIAALLSDNLLSAAGAYGLALQVMGQGKISSSLLPETIRRDKMWAEKTKWFVGAAALFMLGALIPYGRWYWDSNQFNSAENQDLLQKINTVQTKAAHLDGEWSKVESAGGPEKQVLLNARGISEGKDVWPLINTLIYNTLPQNADNSQPELTSTDPAAIKKIKRGDRNQIIVCAQYQRYVPDVAAQLLVGLNPDTAAVKEIPYETGSSGGAGANGFQQPGGNQPTFGGPPAGGPPAKPERGYIITLKLTTPSSKGIDVIAKFNSALMGFTPTPAMPFVIRAAKIDMPMKVREDQTTMNLLSAQYTAKQAEKERASVPGAIPGGGGGGVYPPPTGGGGFIPHGGGNYPGRTGGFAGGGGGYPGAPGLTGGDTQKVPDEAFLDPVLNEDVRDDTECVVVFALVVDPNIPPPAPGAPSTPKTVAAATPAGSVQP